MRISKRRVGSRQWAVGSKERASAKCPAFAFNCQLPTACCLLLLALFANASAYAQAKRIVLLKVDGLQPDIVDRFVRERNPRTGKSLLPWTEQVFYKEGARLENFYVRGMSLSAPSWSMLDTGQHLQIKGNVEYDRFTLHTYDYLNFLPFYISNIGQRRVDMPGPETLDDAGLPLLVDAYPPSERYMSFQLYQRGLRWRTLQYGAQNRFLKNPRELLDEWTMGFEIRNTIFDQLERELVERLNNPSFRYLDLYITDFDHMAHHNRDREAHLYALQTLDGIIGRIWTAIQKTPQAKDTALILVSDHGFNTDERIYSQGYNLVKLLGSAAGGGHHVITKRRLMLEYSIKGFYPLVPLITTTTSDSFYLKGQSTDYPTALLDFDGNERASIHLRDSDLNVLHILLQQLQRKDLAPQFRQATMNAFFKTLDRRRAEWQQELGHLNEEIAALHRANQKQRQIFDAQVKKTKEEKKKAKEDEDVGGNEEARRVFARLDSSETDEHKYTEYARTLTNLLTLRPENLEPSRIHIEDVIAKGAMGTHNSIHALQNYVVGFAPGGPQLAADGSLDMQKSFQRVDYFALLNSIAMRNNVQPEVDPRPIDFVAVRLPRESLAPLLERDLQPTGDVVWIYDGENQALILSRQDEAGRLSLRYLPIANLKQDEKGAISFERVEWRAGLPLKIWEDANLNVPQGTHNAWLNEWHTDLEWLRALHKTAYSNGIIGLHEQLARHPNEAFETDVPGLSDDERTLRRFRREQRELVEADLLVLANNHWNFDVRGFNPGGNHGSFFRISTHSTLMLAGGESTGIPRGLVIEEPYDSLSFMPTVLSLTGQLKDDRVPVPVLWERGFRRFPGRIITEVLKGVEHDRKVSPVAEGVATAP
ncbi:MAG: Type phosphodiesterase / nucleotide pyrophosphatase [Acidobacteriota bacterium]|nr:Type phosphodiesterase / nucleotide pyrophosphatase [Acidobacteriota bacterium]